MCQSLPISLGSWLLILVSACGLVLRNHRNDRWLAVFLLVFGQIQVAEALLWALWPTSSPHLSLVLYTIGLILWSQPLVNSLGAYLDHPSKPKSLLLMVITYTGVLIYWAISAYDDVFALQFGPNRHLIWQRFDRSSCLELPHLIWQRFDPSKCLEITHVIGGDILSTIYLWGMISPFYYLHNRRCQIVVMTYGLLAFVLAMVYYPKEFGSMWCLHAIFLGVVALICN